MHIKKILFLFLILISSLYAISIYLRYFDGKPSTVPNIIIDDYIASSSEAKETRVSSAPAIESKSPIHITLAIGSESPLNLGSGEIVTFPKDYLATRSYEKNRRGSFASYDFIKKNQDYKTPTLSEIQLFSKNSIQDFSEKCLYTLCFEGNYPDISIYQAQKQALLDKKGYEDYKIKEFNSRFWLIKTFAYPHDNAFLREYSTFLGETKIDISIIMKEFSEELSADELFKQIKIK